MSIKVICEPKLAPRKIKVGDLVKNTINQCVGIILDIDPSLGKADYIKIVCLDEEIGAEILMWNLSNCVLFIGKVIIEN